MSIHNIRLIFIWEYTWNSSFVHFLNDFTLQQQIKGKVWLKLAASIVKLMLFKYTLSEAKTFMGHTYYGLSHASIIKKRFWFMHPSSFCRTPPVNSIKTFDFWEVALY